jgi:hypothetical protein
MFPRKRLVLAALLAGGLAACGGSGGGTGGSGSGTPPASPPPPPSGGGTTTSDPCSTASASEASDALSLQSPGARPPADKKVLVDGNPRGRLAEALWLHRAARGRMRRDATEPAPAAQDVGDIAVLQDQGDIVLPANGFDLAGSSLRFTPSGSGYAIAKSTAVFRSSLGRQLTLGDDDSLAVDVPFSLRFFGASERAAFVNSDGNVTFGRADKASTERNISRVLTGPPRIAPFLADLDPSAGGRVFVDAASDRFTVTWCGVRGFDSERTVTTQLSFTPDGAIDMAFGQTTLGDAVVAIGPGETGDFTPVDLSTPTPAAGTGAIGERFAAASNIDTVAAAQRFFATHPDDYDQILFWSDQPLIQDAFAYEVTIANEIKGIGQDVYDLSRDFGSAGRLRSVVVMDWLGKYPDNPSTRFLGENNTLSVIGQEVGHRWLAYLGFRDHTGATSDALLGRDLAHWSFFFNSEASVMEGNEITDLGGGQFKTTDAVRRYSRLDQYAMGLLPASEVPPMFYVEAPNSSHAREDGPRIGVTFTGTRRDFLINDVIAVNGDRSPAADASPRTHRQAFIYIVTSGRTLDNSQAAKLDTIRRAWEPFFFDATDRRMTAITRLGSS